MIRLFADDSLLYRTIKSKEDIDILQKDLATVMGTDVEDGIPPSEISGAKNYK